MMTLELLARAKSGEGVKSGPIGLAVILLLCVAVYFLFKSMSKHLRRVRENFPDDDAARASAGAAASTAGSTAGSTASSTGQQPAPTAPDQDRAAHPAPPLPPQAPPPPPADPST